MSIDIQAAQEACTASVHAAIFDPESLRAVLALTTHQGPRMITLNLGPNPFFRLCNDYAFTYFSLV